MNTSIRNLLARNVKNWMARVPEASNQAKLAARAGMSQSSIHRVLHAATEPELSTIVKLAKALGISIGTLLSDEDASELTPFGLDRYRRLPREDKEKINAFIEFMIASRQADESGAALTHKESIHPTKGDEKTADELAQRYPSDHTLTNHERKNNVRERKEGSKRS